MSSKKEGMEEHNEAYTQPGLNFESDLDYPEDSNGDVDMNLFISELSSRRKRGAKKSKTRVRARFLATPDVQLPGDNMRGPFSDSESNFLEIEENFASPRPRNLSTECVPDLHCPNVTKRAWLNLRLPSNRWSTNKEVGMFSSGKDLSAEEVFDLVEAEFTEAEESDLSDSGLPQSETPGFPLGSNKFVKSRVRAWGRRRVQQSAHV